MINMDFVKQNKFMCLVFALDIIAIIVAFLLHDPILIDSMEHLRDCYLVSIGEVPYRDFFEHHHPLLWYTFAPLIHILPHNALLALYVVKGSSLLISLLTLYVLYMIVRDFFGERELYLYFLLCLLAFFPIWYIFSSFKPDVCARLCYFGGLYLFFSYIRQQKTSKLVWCAFLLFTAFLFLQNFLFQAGIIAIVAITLYYNNRQFYRDALLASCFPLLITFLLLYVFKANDLLAIYFDLNWTFNTKVAHYLFFDMSRVLYYWALHIILILMVAIYQLRKNPSIYYKITFVLFCSELLLNIAAQAPYPHYLTLLMTFGALLTAQPLLRFWNSLPVLYIKILIIFIPVAHFIFLPYKTSWYNLKSFQLVNQSPDNSIFDFAYKLMNIYEPNTNYYTVITNRLIYGDNMMFNRFPDYDINKFIEQHKTKFITLDDNINIDDLPQNRFVVSKETFDKYKKVRHNLYQRKDTIENED